MTDEKTDVIQHLLQIENEAAVIIKEAQKKADAKIAEAKALAETQFKTEFTKITSNIEKKELSDKEKILANHKKQIENYNESLNALAKDSESFNTLLEKLLKA